MADFDAVHITTHCNFGENLEETLQCAVYVTILFNGNYYRKLTRRPWKFLQPDNNRKGFKLPESSIKKFFSRSVYQQSCYRSGRTNHTAADCKFKDVERHKCGKKGHIAPACRSKMQPQGHPSQQKQKRRCHKNRTWFRIIHQPQTLMRAVVRNIYTTYISCTLLLPHGSTGAGKEKIIGGYGSSSIFDAATGKAKFSNLKLYKSNVMLKM